MKGLQITEGLSYRMARKNRVFGVLWGSRYQRVRDTVGLKKPSVRSTVELEITEGSRYRGVEKPSVWSTVELEITEGTR